MGKFVKILFWVVLLNSCARQPVKIREEAMRPLGRPPLVVDDLGWESLGAALEVNIRQLKKSTDTVMVFGPNSISRTEYACALEKLQAALKESPAKFQQVLQSDFQWFENYGKKTWGDVFMTSYFEPVIPGARKKTERFSQPLYRAPDDMVKVDLSAYAEKFPKFKEYLDRVNEQRSLGSFWRGRLEKRAGANTILPYFDRAEIDQQNKLAGRKLEMVWVDPIDAFFLQIQGSGVVRFADNKEMRVTYATQNGHPYVAIGQFLYDRIPAEQVTYQKIVNLVRTFTPEERHALFNKNPSYVFFQEVKTAGITFFGNEVIPGRTIATDQGLFPKGALAFVEFDKPVFEDEKLEEPTKWEKTSRFVLDQDTGGAIRGPGRLDLFWGRGEEAAKSAGVIKNWGRLYYLFPKNLCLATVEKPATTGSL